MTKWTDGIIENGFAFGNSWAKTESTQFNDISFNYETVSFTKAVALGWMNQPNEKRLVSKIRCKPFDKRGHNNLMFKRNATVMA